MIRAAYSGNCDVCGDAILPGQPIVIRKDAWAHPRCANGADDE